MEVLDELPQDQRILTVFKLKGRQFILYAPTYLLSKCNSIVTLLIPCYLPFL